MSLSGKKNQIAVHSEFHVPHGTPSLPEVYQTIEIPQSLGFWRKMLAFAGPGYMVAVGYMDPGNWATDLAAGARFNYTLLSVIMISNLMAILLQALAVKLGVVTGEISPKHAATTIPSQPALFCGFCVKLPSRRATWPR